MFHVCRIRTSNVSCGSIEIVSTVHYIHYVAPLVREFGVGRPTITYLYVMFQAFPSAQLCFSAKNVPLYVRVVSLVQTLINYNDVIERLRIH